MNTIPWDHIGIGSGWAAFLLLAGFAVRAVIKGDFIPRSTHEREVEHAEHEAQEWRTEGRIKDQQIAELQTQNRHVREVGKTVNAIMRSIGHNARSGDRISREEDS